MKWPNWWLVLGGGLMLMALDLPTLETFMFSFGVVLCVYAVSDEHERKRH